MNANTPAGAFPEEIRGHASSIRAETGVNVSRVKLAAEIIKNLDGLCTAFPDDIGHCLEKYRERCVSVGKDALILHDNEKERVFAESISDDFGLVVRCAEGIRRLTSGEISVRPLSSP